MTQSSESSWRVKPARDLSIIGLGLAGTMSVLVEVAPPPCLPQCTPARMNALDRLAIGSYASEPLLFANVLLVVLALALLLLHLRFERGRERWLGLVVFVQAVILVQAVVQLAKFAVGRLAPFVYVPGTAPEVLSSPDAFRSFPSGHTASAFVLATLVVVVVWRHVPRRATRSLVLAAALASALAVGPLKIAAGYHYWTDVIAGALVGVSLGVLVPVTHLRRRRVAALVSPAPVDTVQAARD